VLSRNKSYKRRKLPAPAERSTVANRGNDGRSDEWPDALDGAQAMASCIRRGDLFDIEVRSLNLLVHALPFCPESGYYIAAINIEETYHGIAGGEFLPFEGIVLTDTFQMTESAGLNEDLIFTENNQRATKQKKQPIRVILGNPPYSAQQDSENDNNKNLSYPRLDEEIRQSYAKRSNAKLVKNLYDSYIRAIRWASDRVGDKGIVCFVSNGSFIDANNMDGLRKCLADEYSSIYCFNLRGNARTQGEVRRKEAGNVFGGGTRAPIAITLMVKNPERAGNHKLYAAG
jgi:predicted helicase